jgi:tRNA-2-methylthio-N6-dimethylallyladenosine synthase
MKPRYFIQTFGCQMNVHDSERMAGMLDSLGYEPTPEPAEADVLLMNTCAVRERPEHKLYSELGDLRKLKQKNPNVVIGVAGCMAQREADGIRRRVPEVDILLGPRNLHHLPHLLRETRRRHGEGQYASEADGLDLECDPTPVTPVRRSSPISAYVDIIFGCNFKCTYCAVPSARGREVSRKPLEILDEIRQLSDLGYREITLLGQTVNAYGHDLGERLPNGKRADFAWLLEEINNINSKLRVRYTSPHPMYFNDRLIDVIASTPAICEHLHMPLQSGDNDCLRRMKRTYTIEKYRAITDKVRERIPNVAITTDLIVGFCGETEEEFQNTLKAVRDVAFDQAFMFAYSPRKLTESWEWQDDVPAKVKSRRLTELIEVQNGVCCANNEKLRGQTVEVLVEGESHKDVSRLAGRTRNNKLVIFPGALENYPIGSLVQVKTVDAALWGFHGEVVSAPLVEKPRVVIPLVMA